MLGVRTAGVEEEKALLALLDLSFTPYVRALGREVTPVAYQRLSDALARGDVRVAIEGDAILGFASLVPHGDALEVDLLAVAPEAQRRGIGRILLDDAEARARAAGLARLELHTAAMFGHLLRLYASAGYRETHRGLPSHGADAFERVYFEKRL